MIAPSKKWLKQAAELEGDADIHAGPKVESSLEEPQDEGSLCLDHFHGRATQFPIVGCPVCEELIDGL